MSVLCFNLIPRSVSGSSLGRPRRPPRPLAAGGRTTRLCEITTGESLSSSITISSGGPVLGLNIGVICRGIMAMAAPGACGDAPRNLINNQLIQFFVH